MTSQPATKATATKATPPTAPAKGKPGRKPGQKVVKKDTDFELDFLAQPTLASEAEVRKTAPQRERSDVQRTMDALIPKAHEAWVKAGRPSAWGKLPVITYRVPPEKVEGLKYLIRRAADFNGVRVRFGSAVRDTDGLEIVAFAVLDRRPNGDSSEESES